MSQYMTLYRLIQSDTEIRRDLLSNLYASSHHSLQGFEVSDQNNMTECENELDGFDSDYFSGEENSENRDSWKKSCPIRNSDPVDVNFTFQNDNVEIQIFAYPYDQRHYTRSIDCFKGNEEATPENIDLMEIEDPSESISYRYRINVILKDIPENSDKHQVKLAVGPVIWTCKGLTAEEEGKQRSNPLDYVPTWKFLLQTDDITVHNTVKLNSQRRSAQFCYDLKLPTVDEVSGQEIVRYDVQPLFVTKWEGLARDSIPENENFELIDYGVDGANDPKQMPNSDLFFLPRVYSFPWFRMNTKDVKML